MRRLVVVIFLICFYTQVTAQVSARLMRFPDVSESEIVFAYGNDIWIVGKEGGIAHRLSSPQGQEQFPKFSPDGAKVAFTANYDGNDDVYVMPAKGGLPNRLTYHGMPDRTLDWTNDGTAVLFASSRESGKQRFNQFYTISTNGGMAEKLPVAYGFIASYSPDGSHIAFTDVSRVHRTWKRYEGGSAADIHLFNLTTYETVNITNNKANDEIPMWGREAIYFISDRGPAKRYNLWKYNLSSKQTEQITSFTEFDIHYPSLGPQDIVFQAGDQLYLLNLATEKYEPVDIKIISDQKSLMPQLKKVSKYLQSATVSPDGKRVIVQARGELFNLPAKEGFVANLTQTSGVAERSPAWSPDGKQIAYWSDAGGEYQLVIRNMENGQTRTITSFTDGFKYDIFWSPDSEKLAYVNQAMEIQFIDVTSGALTTIDKGRYMYEGTLSNFSVSWSPDSRWLTYSIGLNRVSSVVFIYDINSKIKHQVTSGFYSDSNPVFSADGKQLFYTTNRKLLPDYSDLDNTFIYQNTSQLAVTTLKKETESVLSVKNDEVEIEEEKPAEEVTRKSKKKKNDDEEKEESIVVTIGFEGLESRTEIIDGPSGNLGRLSVSEGKLIYVHYPNNGAADDAKPALKYYDIKEREHKTIISGVSAYELAANGENILIVKDGKVAVIKNAAEAEMKDVVPTGEMAMYITPREEWEQLFREAWRLERDYFYDAKMHGVNWDELGSQYGSLIDQANSREDVNFIIGELIGELNASHTYRFGGDQENGKAVKTGYLGADFVAENGRYKVAKIIKGAEWDIEVVSPLSQSGVNVNEGDYILAINGLKMDTSKPIYAWLQGLANESVELTVNTSASFTGSRKVVVKPLSSETRLRHLAWINANRMRVEEATAGKIGYVFVPSTGRDGQTELIRQYYGQLDKQGMIIDERFNNGGQIPDRFIEILNRKPLAFWAVRDGADWEWPPVANFGPKVMLINGFSGSGGDAFPDYFRKAGLGPLIGMRTWGGLIGYTGNPGLIDGGGVTVPTFRMYDPDGNWFKEGHGVDPDIEVPQNFEELSKGTDVQLEAAIKEVLERLNSPESFKIPTRPAGEDRSK